MPVGIVRPYPCFRFPFRASGRFKMNENTDFIPAFISIIDDNIVIINVVNHPIFTDTIESAKRNIIDAFFEVENNG